MPIAYEVPNNACTYPRCNFGGHMCGHRCTPSCISSALCLPYLPQFAPELVLVSAGFDAAQRDPLGACAVSPTGYAQMTHMLSSLAHGRLVLALEGGYNLTSLKECFAACVSVMLGDPCPPPPRHIVPSDRYLPFYSIILLLPFIHAFPHGKGFMLG